MTRPRTRRRSNRGPIIRGWAITDTLTDALAFTTRCGCPTTYSPQLRVLSQYHHHRCPVLAAYRKGGNAA